MPRGALRREADVFSLWARRIVKTLKYPSLAEDLASHGYVVVGFDAPYRTGLVVFPDGRAIGRTEENNPERCVALARDEQERCAARLIDAWTADTAFVLDRFAQLNGSAVSGPFSHRLDMSRVGLFGHSFGGAAIAEFCRVDARCKAGVDIDGAPHGRVIETGLRQPFMFLLSDHRRDADPESREVKAITSYCLHAFFDAHLKGLDASAAIPSPEYPVLQNLR